MAMKNTEIHALTTAEISRQIRMHNERRIQIINQRADLYTTALKNGGSSETPVIDDDEKAARQHAKHLLNGAAPESLSSTESGITLDKKLYRELRGVDIALKILGDKDLVARAADAVVWEEEHADEWRTLCRETVLTAIKLDALESRARQLLEQCVDLSAVRLPMVNIVGSRSISEIPLSDLAETALAQGVVTEAELRKAQNVEQ
jgi:hypothetical protein